jgi:adenosylcobinamide-GDP ribazoletransferase
LKAAAVEALKAGARDGLKAVVTAFAFLTRIPVWNGPLRDEDLGRSVAFFPLVGLVLGLGLAGVGTVADDVVSPMVVAVLLAALLAGLTGGFHLDGFADVFDALGGGRGDRARMLELMRDSRIGAHGAAALALLIAAKVAALTQVAERHDLLTLLAFPTVGRWAVTPLIVFFPYARPEGLGRAFKGAAGRVQVGIASAIAVVTVAVLGARFVLPALASAVVVLLFGLWLRRRLGGLTGDVYGAAIELGEVTTLILAGALR